MFFHIAEVRLYGALGLILAAVIVVCRFAYRKRLWVRLIVSITAAPIGLVVTLILGLLILAQFMGCESHGSPIYSPDGSNAAMIWTNDGGALGGDSSVILYDWHGLRSGMVYGGGWKSVDEGDVHWSDNSHITIHYYQQGYVERKSCKDFHTVQVTCIPK